MLCPTGDNVNLSMTDRQGVEIDYCPQCRGIWLDRGELDRLIERAEQGAAPAMPAEPPQYVRDHPRTDYERERERDRYRSGDYKAGYQKRKPKSLLGELFDF